MYCTNCGTKNSDAAKFCRNCGMPMAAEAPVNTAKTEPAAFYQEDDGETMLLGNDMREAAREQSKKITEGQMFQEEKNVSPAEAYHQPESFDQSVNNGQTYSGEQSFAQPYQNYDGQNQNYGGQNFNGQNQNYGGQNYSGQNHSGQSQNFSGQNPYQTYGAQNPYQAYGPQDGQPHGKNPAKAKKKGKKGIIIAAVIILLVVLIGGIGYTAVKSSDPMSPVNAMMKGMEKGDWGKVYDSIYWGEDPEYTKKEFLSEAESMGDLASLGVSFSNLKISKVSEGSSYVGDDGLTRKDLTVKMSMSFMGMTQEEETEITVVKAGKKFLFIPVWKVDSESSGMIW